MLRRGRVLSLCLCLSLALALALALALTPAPSLALPLPPSLSLFPAAHAPLSSGLLARPTSTTSATCRGARARHARPALTLAAPHHIPMHLLLDRARADGEAPPGRQLHGVPRATAAGVGAVPFHLRTRRAL